MKYRRVNIYAGPGAGKSVLASWLFAELKIAGLNIQFVEEYLKKWAYEGKQISSFDHVYILAKQMHKEDSYLRAGADYIISDSPLLIVGGYATRNKDPFTEELISLAKKFDDLYPAVNIFLDREGIPYQQAGRFEDYEEATRTDAFILGVLKEHTTYEVFRTRERNQILEYVLEKLK